MRRPTATICRQTIPLVLLLTLTTAAGCRRETTLPESTYREAVTAFYVALAALQTSQDALARKELDHFVQLAPNEPAGWANLGLLLIRQQQLDEATVRLARASELAPQDAAIERLRAQTESRRGNLEQSVRHWRRAIALDATDLKAPFALAQELERLGGADNEAEAQRQFASVASRSNNLAAAIEHARIAAKRGDTTVLAAALDALAAQSSPWPPDARNRLTAVRDAARGNPGAATTSIIFLKNVLIRDPEYRAALAAVSTPRSEVGEPLTRFLTLRNPTPQPAAPDEQLAFTPDASAAARVANSVWGGAVWLAGDAPPVVAAAGAAELRLATGSIVPLAAGSSPTLLAPDAIAAADLNYDFRTDLIVTGPSGLRIFRQTDKGAFAPVTAATKLGSDVLTSAIEAVWPADVDTDGDLDLVIARREGPPAVLRNNGDDTFTQQLLFPTITRVRGFAWADVDGEGVPDATLLDDQGSVRVFLNLRGSRFREVPVPGQFPRVVAIAAADVTADGIVDVIGVAADGTIVRLSQPAGRSQLEAARLLQIEPPAGMTPGNSKLLIADLDNNGASDLVVSAPSASRVLLGTANAGFRALPALAFGSLTSAADLDGDGRVELIGRADEGARVVRVKGQKQYHWQAIRPRATSATGDQRINSYGVGGEVEIRAGLHAQKQVIASPVVHFGLGESTGAEVARITWPNGFLQSEFGLAADTQVSATQRLKGSCPWLFAWNGTEMRFVTDFIWRSPLGLRINAQATADVAMTEDWVKIRGDQLAASNGVYDLRITAELWESHFFDLVSLLVVDHPADTEVFVDERFAVPPPRLGVIATSPLQEFHTVRDDRGEDVREMVRARDDRHLDFAGRGRYQGVTREHSIDLELPEAAPRTGRLWLVAQGWIHPTDSSINVALGQGSHAPPAGLSLHVADARGRFRPVRTGLGFPAGKDKTILIDLSRIFAATGPRRLRLSTNLEIFWDRLAWAVDRPDVTLRPQRLELKTAELQFRGYSVTERKDASTPERPRYLVDGVAPRWRDLEGFHTRFGDVRELLQAVDDRYVIMNAGDELRVAFPAVPAPAPGMTRDFVLVGDGWEKDGDYNTVASRTVLPLPTHRSTKYESPASERLEDDPVYRQHRADFERYHTRYVSSEPTRDALRVKIDKPSARE
ncbi:MAG TPA: FG-GAP-like repeat-containing protein [Vicinamibacterales bacterium]|jgi:tetratricopeptide (TPR) repeat protein